MLEDKALPSDGDRIWKVSTAPAIEPITVEEVKEFARIDGNDEDSLISGFIQAARTNCEAFLGRALIEQTITMKMDFWPGAVIDLPRPPLIAITAVETLDEDDNATEYTSTNYYTVTESIPGQLVLKRDVTWPTNSDRDYQGYQIRFTAGYGAKATDVPRPIREGLKLWVTDIYENRVIRPEPPPEAMTMLNLYRVLHV